MTDDPKGALPPAAPRAPEKGPTGDDGPSGGLSGMAGGEVVEAPPREPPDDRVLADFELSDLGNADRLIARFGDDLLYVRNRGFFVWESVRFRHDGDRPLFGIPLTHKVARAVTGEARALGRDLFALRSLAWKPGETPVAFAERIDEVAMKHPAVSNVRPGPHTSDEFWEKEIKPPAVKALSKRVAELHKWAVACGNNERSGGMLRAAAPYLIIRQEELDADAYLLTVANGTLQLPGPGSATAEARLRAARREDRITRMAAAAYDPQAECPLFDRFLERVIPDVDVRAFLRRYVGLCLTGDPSVQAALIHHGEGKNGKSTFVETVRFVLGEYGATIPIARLIGDDRQKTDGPDPLLARLAGARIVTASEPKKNATLNDDVLKLLLGMEMLSTRDMYAGLFDFMPVFKLMISTNSKPTIKTGDEGLWRRLHFVPWTVQVPEAERDGQLGEKLRLEANGILNWALAGYADLCRHGLSPPSAVTDDTAAYRSTADPIGEFLKDAVARETGAFETATDLYCAYLGWCEHTETASVSQKAFGQAMDDKQIKKRRVSTWRYVDVRLTDGGTLVGRGRTILDEQRKLKGGLL
jgi:putative DNA primase/helicase